MSEPSNAELIDAWQLAQSTTDNNRKFWVAQRLKDRLAEYGNITPDDCDSLGMKRDELRERCNELEALLPVVIAQREHLLKALKEVEQELPLGYDNPVMVWIVYDGVRLDLANYDEIGRPY